MFSMFFPTRMQDHSGLSCISDGVSFLSSSLPRSEYSHANVPKGDREAVIRVRLQTDERRLVLREAAPAGIGICVLGAVDAVQVYVDRITLNVNSVLIPCEYPGVLRVNKIPRRCRRD